jgi:ferredoxin--NADP+ reductase
VSKVAIIGSGPSGCYVAQALLKACPEAEVTVIERLTTPYGLVRYGVAADHQGTKGVTRQFARLFERQGVGFVGNVTVGQDVSLDDMRMMFDAVVIATGLHKDRPFGVPGEDLDGVYGSGMVTRHWNGHPDSDQTPDFGQEVVVFGNGNVAMDVVRLLAKRETDFAGSDFDPAHVCDGVRRIHVVGRSSLAQAKCDAVMVRELSALSGCRIDRAEGEVFAKTSETALAIAFADAFETPAPVFTKHITFHSGWTLEAFEGDGHLESVVLSKDGRTKRLSCDSAITAIGFDYDGAFDRDAILESEGQGLYTAGWFKTGPRGTIPSQRADAQDIAARIAADLTPSDKPGRAALLDKLGETATTYADWQLIDRAECAAAAPNRCRAKLRPTMDILNTRERQTA